MVVVFLLLGSEQHSSRLVIALLHLERSRRPTGFIKSGYLSYAMHFGLKLYVLEVSSMRGLRRAISQENLLFIIATAGFYLIQLSIHFLPALTTRAISVVNWTTSGIDVDILSTNLAIWPMPSLVYSNNSATDLYDNDLSLQAQFVNSSNMRILSLGTNATRVKTSDWHGWAQDGYMWTLNDPLYNNGQ